MFLLILSLVAILIFCIMYSGLWGLIMISLTVLTMISLIYMNQFFSYSLNFLFISNSLSNLMIFLSVYLMLLVFLATKSYSSMKYNMTLLMLLVFLMLTFSSSNIFYFYIFFEASLIPTLALIVGWGYQPERLQAGTYMMIYTVMASLPLLAMISYLFYISDTSEFFLFSMVSNFLWGNISVIFIYLAFLVKLPIYSGHLWLPKAHVEAPLAGSMILAGILLKLGGYGLIMMNMAFSLGGVKSVVTTLFISVSMWGALLASLMCLRQIDVKAFVAYSSIGHMSVVILGSIFQQTVSLMSATVTMFAHAFSSSALFCLAYYTYQKINTRSMMYMKGFLMIFPSLSMMWFIFSCINMAAPPTLNLLGEMLIIPMLSNMGMSFMVVMGLCIFFSAMYNMVLYSSVNHGKSSEYMLGGIQLSSNQLLVLMMHLVPLLFLFKMDFFV